MQVRRFRLAIAAMLAAMLAWAGAPNPAFAGPLEAGQSVRSAIDVRLLRKIPLPPGRWKVETSFEESVTVTSEISRSLTQPTQVLVLSNEDRDADIAVLVLDFTDNAGLNWTGQPCDEVRTNKPLATNTLGTTGSSLNVRCNRISAFDAFRQTIQRVNVSSPAWIHKRFTTLASRADEMPVHTLVAYGYASAYRGDRVSIWAYANPAQHGLDGASDPRSPFRDLDRADDRAASARAYVKAFAEWFDAYTDVVFRRYLEGSRDAAEAPKFQFGSPPLQATAATRPAAPLPVATPTAQVATPPAALPQATPAAAKPPRQAVHALVIGNSAYPGAALPNPANDARAIAQRLRSYGFEVTMLLDATRKQMVEAMSRFADSARRADVTIVFYAGHGLQLHGVNYLIPVDLNLANTKAVGLAFEAVSLNTLLEDHLPGKAKLVFLDACRDNPLARSLAATRGSNRGLAPMNAATGTLISYATRDGSTAADGTGTNSPYTTALLAHLDEAEDISIVLRRVRQRVMDSTRGAQEPWEYGSLVGDKLVLSQLGGTR